MSYKIRKASPIRCGHLKNGAPRFVPAFQVVDETGAVRCNESSKERAEAHIRFMEEADKRNADAEEDQRRRDKR